LRKVRGRSGGTWGHWKVALDYAAYLSDALKDHISEVFKERIEEEADSELGLQRWQERAERRYDLIHPVPQSDERAEENVHGPSPSGRNALPGAAALCESGANSAPGIKVLF
jgi:hypothetical protein